MKIKAPKGTRDILPEDIGKWRYIEEKYNEICDIFGYSEIRIPTFENTQVFIRGVGDTTDIVQKEMYTFPDKAGRSITLRPEGTAGVARSFVENGMGSLPSPVKLFYNITAFRYENVQKGRYREFRQLGLEAFGSKNPAIDAEIISLVCRFFDSLGIKDACVKINSIGCPVCRPEYNKNLKEFLSSQIEGMCPQCSERMDKNPLRVIDCKEIECKRITEKAPALIDNLCGECKEHFDILQDELVNIGIEYEIDKNIVRGLDYYTKTVFEFVSENVGTQGTICGGGRYDGLIEQFGGPPTPGIGFALGMERLLMEIEAREISFPSCEKKAIFLAFADKAGEKEAKKICFDLRCNSIKVQTDSMNRSLKSQIKFADKAGYNYLCVIGETEIKSKSVSIKDMQTKEIREIGISDLCKLKYNNRGDIIWPKD